MFASEAQRRWFWANFGQKARAKNPEKVKGAIQAERIRQADDVIDQEAERLRPVWREQVKAVRAGSRDALERGPFGPAEREQILREGSDTGKWESILEARFRNREKNRRYKWPGSDSSMRPAWQWKAKAIASTPAIKPRIGTTLIHTMSGPRIARPHLTPRQVEKKATRVKTYPVKTVRNGKVVTVRVTVPPNER